VVAEGADDRSCRSCSDLRGLNEVWRLEKRTPEDPIERADGILRMGDLNDPIPFILMKRQNGLRLSRVGSCWLHSLMILKWDFANNQSALFSVGDHQGRWIG
jgi:hypothetical protein